MLIADALIERADAQRRLADLRQRVTANVVVPQGEAPAEDPLTLLAEAEALVERIRDLAVAVNLANTVTRLPDGATVTAAIAQRDALGARLRLHVEAAQAAAVPKAPRWGLKEIREVRVVDVAALRATADRLAGERQALDARQQRVNWSTELPELG